MTPAPPDDPVQNAGLTEAALAARRALSGGGGAPAAVRALQRVAWSAAMASTYVAMVAHVGEPGADNRIAKDLADFDFGRQRRLGAHPPARPRRAGARTDGHADPALAGTRRAGQGRRQRADRESARGLQRHGAGPADRCGRVRPLAGPRPDLRAGLLRPRVRRRGADRSAAFDESTTAREQARPNRQSINDVQRRSTVALRARRRATAPATRSTGWSTCSTSGSCWPSRSCSLRCRRCNLTSRSPAAAKPGRPRTSHRPAGPDASHPCRRRRTSHRERDEGRHGLPAARRAAHLRRRRARTVAESIYDEHWRPRRELLLRRPVRGLAPDHHRRSVPAHLTWVTLKVAAVPTASRR